MSGQEYGKWKQLLVYSVVAIGIYIGIRCLFTAVFPFFVAVLLMKLFYPAAVFIKEKTKIGKGISVFVLFVVFIGVVGIGLWFVLQKIFAQIGDVFQNLEVYERYMDSFLEECCCRLEEFTGLRAEYVKPYLLGNFYNLMETIRINISEGIMAYSYSYAKSLVKIVGVIVVIMAVTVLLAKDYDKLRGQLVKNPFYTNIKRIKEKVFYAAFIYLRAQLIMILVISGVCSMSFFFMGINQALLLGTGIGILDAFPFIGTGSVLIPWAVIQLFRGEFLSAALLGTLYLVCSFIREFLEPKLIGTKLGVLPVYIVSTVYLGLVLYGFAGVVLGPLQALLTLEIGRQWIEEHMSLPVQVMESEEKW